MTSIRIAIVDDKLLVRTTLIEHFAYYEEITVVFQAGDGREFLNHMAELAPEKIPQVVLMDIEMPILNGIEAVVLARELYPEVHFLMLTVFDNDDKLFEAIRAGATGYLLKDEKIANIVKGISEIVYEGGVPMSPRIAKKALNLLKDTIKTESVPQAATDNYSLTDRELEILNRIVDGLNYNEIAERLFISPHTVRKHITNIYEKLHVSNKASAIKIATANKWFNP